MCTTSTTLVHTTHVYYVYCFSVFARIPSRGCLVNHMCTYINIPHIACQQKKKHKAAVPNEHTIAHTHTPTRKVTIRRQRLATGIANIL